MTTDLSLCQPEPTDLPALLRKTADQIVASPDDYNWESHRSCVCGNVLLASGISAMDDAFLDVQKFGPYTEGLADLLNLQRGNFSPYIAESYQNKLAEMATCKVDVCGVTGVTVPVLIGRLIALGFPGEAVGDLEYVGCYSHTPQGVEAEKKARKSLGVWRLSNDSPEHVVAFLRAYADVLEETPFTTDPSTTTSSPTDPTPND